MPEFKGGAAGAGTSRRFCGGLFQFPALTSLLVRLLLLAALAAPTQALIAADSVPKYSMTLAWNPSPNPKVVGYRVYYGGSSGNYTHNTDVGNMTSNTVSGLTSLVAYYFIVTAYDASGLETVFSSEIRYALAIPTVHLSVTSGKQFVLTVGGQAGHTYDLWATRNFTTWTVIGTVTLGASGSLQLTDLNAASYPARFYRTRDTQP